MLISIIYNKSKAYRTMRKKSNYFNKIVRFRIINILKHKILSKICLIINLNFKILINKLNFMIMNQ